MLSEHQLPTDDFIILDEREGCEGGVCSAQPSDPRPGFRETSEYMMGDVRVLIVFVESDGTLDPSTESWTADRMEQVENGIYRALNWWREVYPFQTGKPNFWVNAERIIGYTKYEPINRPSSDDLLWIPDVLSNIECGSGSGYACAISCANEIRQQWSMDWAFISFVIDSFNDLDGKFTNDRFAYAVLGGPYLVVTYDNDGWGIENMDRTVAHEMGHIFWATDEYNGKKEYSGYLYKPDIDGSRCIMDTAEWCISAGTREQIGWFDSNYNGHLDIPENELLMETVKEPEGITDKIPLIYEGYLALKPYQCLRPGCRDITINKITQVSATGSIEAKDGTFDSPIEGFTMEFLPLRAGKYNLKTEVKLRYVFSFTVSWSVFYTYLIVTNSMRESNRPRIDVGTTEHIGFRLLWAHDNGPVKSGRIWIRGMEATPRGDGWFYTAVSSSLVGMTAYDVSQAEVTLITDVGAGTMHRVVMDAEPVKIIWDRVSIELFSERQRVDVGSLTPIGFQGYCEYDRAAFDGVVYLNRELAQSSVGRYTYTASSIEDRLYGLTSFKSNAIDVIFDKVVVSLTSPRTRVDVGSTAPLQVEARYAYDSAPLQGETILSENLVQTNVGLYKYKAIRVIDNLYGLTVFDSNELPIIFDRVVIELQPILERIQVGRPAVIKYRGYYEYDAQQFQGEIKLKVGAG